MGGARQILLRAIGFVNKSKSEYLKQDQRGHPKQDRQQAVLRPRGDGNAEIIEAIS